MLKKKKKKNQKTKSDYQNNEKFLINWTQQMSFHPLVKSTVSKPVES